MIDIFIYDTCLGRDKIDCINGYNKTYLIKQLHDMCWYHQTIAYLTGSKVVDGVVGRINKYLA